MTTPRPLAIDYERHPPVRELLDVVQYCLEDISLGFDGWDGPSDHGPGAYFAVVSGRSLHEYADAMGENRWPTEECWRVRGADTGFCETTREVAESRDGAVVVSLDGVIHEQMVRFRDRSTADAGEGIEYADWMGSRHMSALETSARDEVVATLTLSAENGRVTVFRDGTFDARTRDELAAEWRV